MTILEDLGAQLKNHGISSLTDIKQNEATELAEHCLKEVAGGLQLGTDDLNANFWLHNQDRSGIFCNED
jgi:hypothetical protein